MIRLKHFFRLWLKHFVTNEWFVFDIKHITEQITELQVNYVYMYIFYFSFLVLFIQ